MTDDYSVEFAKLKFYTVVICCHMVLGGFPLSAPYGMRLSAVLLNSAVTTCIVLGLFPGSQDSRESYYPCQNSWE